MRLKMSVVVFLFFISQMGLALTFNHHTRSDNTAPIENLVPAKQACAYTCEVEIINDAYSNVTVYGRYDDGLLLTPFSVYSYEYSHYIDLFYSDYCHSGIYLTIVTFAGHVIFSGYVFTGSAVHVVSLLHNEMKVDVTQKTPSLLSAQE